MNNVPLNKIKSIFKDSTELKNKLVQNVELHELILAVVNDIVLSIKNGGQVLFCGNGGSAADAQHLAAELSNKFYLDRAPINAEALHTNSSYLTAAANDFSYDIVFSKAVEAKAKKGDVLIAITTSGRSKNILKALEKAKSLKVNTIALTGMNLSDLENICDRIISVPSIITPRIQECHILIGHIICELVEKELFGAQL